MIMYRTFVQSGVPAKIDQVDVVSRTETRVMIPGRGRDTARYTFGRQYHDTWEEAKKYLTEQIQSSVTDADKRVVKLIADRSAILSMINPDSERKEPTS